MVEPLEILKQIRAYNKRLEATIDGNLRRFEAGIVEAQEQLLRTIMADFVGRMETANGVVVNSTANFQQVGRIDRVFATFDRLFQRNRLRRFAGDLLEVSKMSLEYYGRIGYGADTLQKIEGATRQVEHFIGINNNQLVRGGYLDSLGGSHAVRLKLKNYVLNSITTKKGYRHFLKGFKNLVVGPNKQTDGILQRYYRQYAYDKFNEVREVANNYAAREIGLKYFIYEGSLIKTSRAFCEKRAGKVFSIKETEAWKDDPTLIEKKTKNSYNPLIERGRYNCRHFLNYISEELAFELRPDLKPTT